MPNRRRVHYRTLATHLGKLPLTATVSDLRLSVAAFMGYDPEYRERLLAAMAALPATAEWFTGLTALCQALKDDNERFSPGVFMEWVLEEK